MDDPQQRRLARAVAPDESDVLAVIDNERGSIEERLQSESELGVLKSDERHPCDYPKAVQRDRGSLSGEREKAAIDTVCAMEATQ